MFNRPKSLAVVTIVFWSFGTYLAKLISEEPQQFTLTTLSFVFTLSVLLVYAGQQHKQSLWERARAYIRVRPLFLGLCGYAIYSVCLQLCLLEYRGASEAAILNYTWPIFTVLFTELVFPDEEKRGLHVRLVEGVGILLGFLAVVVLATEGDLLSFSISNVKGIGWGLVVGASYGLFSAYSSTVPKKEQSLFLLVSVAISVIAMVPLVIFEMPLQMPPVNALAVAAALGCLLNGIGYIAWTRANRLAREQGISISSVASLMFALPPLGLVVIAVLLGEGKLLEIYFMVSLALLLASSALCQRAEVIASAIRRPTIR
jgi:drug/metabolite transporter (DMT)-like permease